MSPASLNDLIASQDALLREAALALPHEFSRCTFAMGPIRQAVYLCLTCATPRGICSSCSIACHTDHEQVELFPKRRFRCDCPTAGIPHPCTLHGATEETNVANHYGHNFRGLFCRCARPYDPKTELETMIQCLACEVVPLLSSAVTLLTGCARVGLVSRIVSQSARTPIVARVLTGRA